GAAGGSAGGAAGGSAGGAAGGSAGGAAGGSAGGAAGGSAGGAAGGSAGGAASTNFMVLRVGIDGGTAAPASGAAVAAFLDEHDATTGNFVRTITLTSTANTPLTISGSATSDGALSRSGNGQYVTVAGYLAAIGTASVNSAAGVARCVARVDAAGAVDTTTVINDAYRGNNFRGATTQDGTVYWLAGAGGTAAEAQDAGVRTVTHGSSGASTFIFNEVANTRAVQVSNGVLYVSTGSGGSPDGGASRVFSLGALPMAPATQTFLPGVNLTNPQGFAVLDLNTAVAGNDALYVADTDSSGGVKKYVLGAGGTWSLAARFLPGLADGGTSTTTCIQATAQRVGNDVIVLCTTNETNNNRVVRFTDVGGAASDVDAGVTLITAPGFMRYRGVAFSPQ
ncbi:MAG: hypothetical protein SFW67_14595, partial [Myxococcaceae bacterium]|nr:hypothetical protein [Myxococcaceae bacterium]